MLGRIGEPPDAAQNGVLLARVSQVSPLRVQADGVDYEVIATTAAQGLTLEVGDQVVVMRVEGAPDRLVVLDSVQAPDPVNATTLGGHGSSYFLPATGTAADSEALDGHDSSYFYSADNPPPASGAMINQTIRGVITVTTAQSSVAATIASVNTAKTQLRYLGTKSGNGTLSGVIDLFHIALTSATAVTATRNTVGGSASCAVSYDLTEWT